MVCRNPHLASERERKRQDLLQATERELDKVTASVANPRGRLHAADAGAIGQRVGRVINKYKVAEHFELEIADGSFTYRARPSNRHRGRARRALRAAHHLPHPATHHPAVVRVYKQLKIAQRAYRTIKDALDVRPIATTSKNASKRTSSCSYSPTTCCSSSKPASRELNTDARLHPGRPCRARPPLPAANKKAGSHHTPDGLPAYNLTTSSTSSAPSAATNYPRRQPAHLPRLTNTNPIQAKALQLLNTTPDK